MIYLFGTGSYKDNKRALKIGFSDSMIERESSYSIHNPLGKFLGWREGTKILEEKLHLRLADYKEDFLDEWFYDEEDVIKIFYEEEEKIDDWLWENRDRLFYQPTIPLPGTIKRQILDNLNNKNKNKEDSC